MIHGLMTIRSVEGSGSSGSLGLVPSGKRSVTPVPASLLALVPKPTDDLQVHKGTDPDPETDTVPLMMKLIRRQLWQGKKLADAIKGNSILSTARNYWNFIFKHIQYVDDGADEVIKSLRKLIYSGKGDCDCFSTALSNLLLNASIPHFLRIAKYNGKEEWSHVYIVIPKNKNMATDSNGNMKETDYITLDCVPHKFNYEVPFTDHKDFAMRLVSLDGFGCPDGGLNCAPGCKRCSSNNPVPRKPRTVIRSKELEKMGFVVTEQVLAQSGIASKSVQSDVNAGNEIVAYSPKGGPVKVPSIIPIADSIKLVSDVMQFTAKETPAPVSTNPVTTVTSTVTPVSTTASETDNKTVAPTAKKAGGILFGLLAASVAVGAMRSSDPTGLSGTPARGKKRMANLSM